jgi:hypothetical protein
MKPEVLEHAISRVVLNFFLNSNEFNGLPLSSLARVCDSNVPNLTRRIASLVRGGLVNLTFSSRFPNPHIKAFPDLPPEKQIELLYEKASEDEICIFPSAAFVQSTIDINQYNVRPFSRRLLLGEPQLLPLFFELTVLDPYIQEPRYHFWNNDFAGSISIEEQRSASEDLKEQDKVFLQTFGLAYDGEGNRVIVVYLFYLSRFSPKHQQLWNLHIIDDQRCYIDRDYFLTSIRGEFPEGMSVYEALFLEIGHINQLSRLINGKTIFRDDFNESRPISIELLLRPTLTNFNNFIHTLDKILSENIDKNFFDGEIALEEEITRKDGKIEIIKKGTLRLLEEWLFYYFPDSHNINLIMAPLKAVRKDRQKPAHNVEKNLYDKIFLERQHEIIDSVFGAIRALRVLIAQHRNCTGYSVPESLACAKIKIY